MRHFASPLALIGPLADSLLRFRSGVEVAANQWFEHRLWRVAVADAANPTFIGESNCRILMHRRAICDESGHWQINAHIVR
jgi:hypothetical protein